MLANLAIEYMKYNMDVSELYSPPRVCKTALKIGLDPGTSFDLTENDPFDNKPWNFSDPEKRKRARDTVNRAKPFLLIGFPPGRAWNTLFKSNINKMSPQQVQRIIAEGKVHMNFCFELYNMQLDQGRLCLHEHPSGAASWKLPEVVELLQCSGVQKVRGDMCAHNIF